MPVALPKPDQWLGSQVRFSTSDEHTQIVDGQPFYIHDATTWLNYDVDDINNAEMRDYTAAFLVTLADPDTLQTVGEPFVWTRTLTNSRKKIAAFVKEQAAQGEVVGPVCVVQIASKDKARSAFYHIANYEVENAGAVSMPDDVAEQAVIDPDDIPF